MKVLKSLVVVLWAIEIMFYAWVFLSWIEIISKNLYPDPVYHPMNLLVWAIERWCV